MAKFAYFLSVVASFGSIKTITLLKKNYTPSGIAEEALTLIENAGIDPYFEASATYDGTEISLTETIGGTIEGHTETFTLPSVKFAPPLPSIAAISVIRKLLNVEPDLHVECAGVPVASGVSTADGPVTPISSPSRP